MKTKRITALMLSLMLTVSLAACAGETAPSTGNANTTDGADAAATDDSGEAAATDDGGDILIGASIGTTGATPLDGERVKQAVELAIKEANENGGILGGRQVKLQVEDNAADQTTCINVANKLISAGSVAVLGPHESTNAMAVQQLMSEKKIPFITGGTSPSLATVNNEYMFRCRASDVIMSGISARYAIDTLKTQKVGILYNNNEYGTGALNVVKPIFDEAGIEYIEEGHNTGDKDVTASLMKIKQAGCDTIFTWSHAAETVVIARQIQELGLEVNVVSSPSPTLPQVWELCEPEWLEGWYAAADFVSTSDEPHVMEFVEKFKAEYGVEPEMFAASWYGAAKALIDAIDRAGSTDPEAIRDALAATSGFQGIVGEISCDAENAFIHEGKIVTIKNLSNELVDTIKMN